MNAKRAMIVLTLAALLQATASAARVRWEIFDGGNGHEYEVLHGPLIANGVHGALTWLNADVLARETGGHLATITSAAENAFVYRLVDAPGYWTTDTLGNFFGPWLGGWQAPNAANPADNWQWVTGEQFRYANWHPGEPNDMFGLFVEDRIVFFANASVTGNRSPYWNDEMQSRRLPVAFVVEFVPEPAAVAMFLAGILSLCSQRLVTASSTTCFVPGDEASNECT